MINHSLRLSRAKIHINYISDLLDTTDNFILGSRVGSSSIEEIINNFKTQLPQKDPWHENQLRYTLSILYKINNQNYEKLDDIIIENFILNLKNLNV